MSGFSVLVSTSMHMLPSWQPVLNLLSHLGEPEGKVIIY